MGTEVGADEGAADVDRVVAAKKSPGKKLY